MPAMTIVHKVPNEPIIIKYTAPYEGKEVVIHILPSGHTYAVIRCGKKTITTKPRKAPAGRATYSMILDGIIPTRLYSHAYVLLKRKCK